jgi:tetratricopeptide (TPR) repeat protein
MLSEARLCLTETSGQYDPAKALGLARKAKEAYPVDLNTVSVYGEALLRAGRPGEAITVLEQALRLFDGGWLNKDAGYVTCFLLAIANQELGREPEAKARLTEGAARYVKGLALREVIPSYVRSYPDGRPMESPHERLTEAARKLGVSVPSLDLDSVTRDSDVLLRECLVFRAIRLANEGRTAEAVAVAGECVANEPLNRDLAYNAACIFARAVPKSKSDPALQARYSDRAIALLRSAVALGWDDVEHLKNDADLIPLHGGEDFKRLVADLERKLRPLDVAPAPRLKR